VVTSKGVGALGAGRVRVARGGGLARQWGTGRLTFSLSSNRKSAFAVFGGGHLGVLGGGARGLSCSRHVRGR
jgi:hypothetical protein